MYIKIEKNADGSHALQYGGVLEPGWAAIPSGMTLPDAFPFVDLEVAEVTHPSVTEVRQQIINGETEKQIATIFPEYTQIEVVSMTALA